MSSDSASRHILESNELLAEVHILIESLEKNFPQGDAAYRHLALQTLTVSLGKVDGEQAA
jgi:hypothetical protein